MEPLDTKQTVQTPELLSSRIRMREVRPSDYPFLYELAVAPGDSFRWRFRGSQPGFEEFVQSLRQGVFLQFLIVAQKTGVALGLAVCYRADFRNRNAYIALQGAPYAQERGVLVEAGRLFINFLFGCYDFEKLYAECPEFNIHSFQSGLGSGFVEEGVLRGHERFLGRAWDLHILALHRTSYAERQQEVYKRRSSHAVTKGLGDYGSGISFDDFAKVLSDEMDLGDYQLLPTMSLQNDLGFDSIQLFEMIDFLEMLGSRFDDQAAGRMLTLGDVHFEFIQNHQLSTP